jgi:hypothetical protein
LGFGALPVAGARLVVPKDERGWPSAFPALGPYPSKGSPRQQPLRITAVVALLPLPQPTDAEASRVDVGGAEALVHAR